MSVKYEGIESILFEVKRDDFRPLDRNPRLPETEAAKYKRVAEIYFGETDDNREAKVEELRQKLAESTPKLLKQLPSSSSKVKEEASKPSSAAADDEKAFLLKILRAGGFDVNAAANLLANYVEMIKSAPKYFGNAFRNGNPAEVKLAFESQVNTMLPYRDKYGRRVYLLRFGHWDPDVISFNHTFCIAYMMTEMVAMEEETQIAGVTSILDGENFGLKQFRNCSFEDLKYICMILQDNLPLWFRTIHVVNCPYLLNTMIAMARPLLHERVRDAIVVHDSLDSLHQHVDKSILPENLGGTAGKFDNSDCQNAITSCPQIFNQIENYIFQE